MKTRRSRLRCCAGAGFAGSTPRELTLPRMAGRAGRSRPSKTRPPGAAGAAGQDATDRGLCKLDGEGRLRQPRPCDDRCTCGCMRASTGGKVDRLRALAAACPVETGRRSRELGTFARTTAPAGSSAWRSRAEVKTSRDETCSPPGHASRRPRTRRAWRDGPRRRARGDAQARRLLARPGARHRRRGGHHLPHVQRPDPDVRQHAAFALTQSKSPRVAADLIRLGNTDKEGDVRAQAWFWLAHTGAPKRRARSSRR